MTEKIGAPNGNRGTSEPARRPPRVGDAGYWQLFLKRRALDPVSRSERPPRAAPEFLGPAPEPRADRLPPRADPVAAVPEDQADDLVWVATERDEMGELANWVHVPADTADEWDARRWGDLRRTY